MAWYDIDVNADISKWVEYQNRVAGGKPRSLLVEALSYVEKRDAALDLGAGALTDAQLLLDQDFTEVIAVDIAPQFKGLSYAAGVRFKYIQERIEKYEFAIGHFDLISAQYALPFVSPENFSEIWTNIRDALKTKGVFTGQIFGERDDWFGRNGIAFHTKEMVENLIGDGNFKALVCREEEYSEPTGREKHWHYFDLILKKMPAH